MPRPKKPPPSYSTVDYVRVIEDDAETWHDETVAAASAVKRVRLDLPADISYVTSHPAFVRVINGDEARRLTKKDLSGDLAPPSQEAVTLLSWAMRNPDKFMDKLMAMQVNSQRRISDKASGGADAADAVDDDLTNVEEALRAKLSRC